MIKKTRNCFRAAVTLERCKGPQKIKAIENVLYRWRLVSWCLWWFLSLWHICYLPITGIHRHSTLPHPCPRGTAAPGSTQQLSNEMNSIFHFKQKTGLTLQAMNHNTLKRKRRELYFTKTISPGEQAQRGPSHFPNGESWVLFLFELSFNSLHSVQLLTSWAFKKN